MVRLFLVRLVFSRTAWRAVVDYVSRLLWCRIHRKIVHWHSDWMERAVSQ